MKSVLYTISLLILALIPALTNAQIMFQRHYGGTGDDGGNAVIQTSDGGYLVAGLTDSWGAGSNDIYLIKTNEYGDTAWTKHYGGYNWDDAAAVIEGTDNNFYITGGVSSFSNGATDAFLMKVSSVGDSVWLKTYGGTEDDDGYDLLQCQDGGLMIAGVSCSFATGFSSMFVIRTDNEGDTLWTKTYEKADYNVAYAVVQMPDNGFLMAGISAPGIPSTSDGYVVRINSTGDTLWTKTCGGALYDAVVGLCALTDGSYLLSGTTASIGAGGYDMYLIKIDTNGGVIWEKTYGGSVNDYGAYCTATAFGAVAVGKTNSLGHGGSDAYMVAVDQSGDTLWTHTYGLTEDDFVNTVVKTTDGGYVMSGYSFSYTGNSDVYLIKTLADGFVGIENHELSGIVINLYPNPCSDILNITSELFTSSNFRIEIFNAAGHKMYDLQDSRCADNRLPIDVSGFSAGVYCLKISDDKTQFTRKLIIQK